MRCSNRNPPVSDARADCRKTIQIATDQSNVECHSLRTSRGHPCSDEISIVLVKHCRSTQRLPANGASVLSRTAACPHRLPKGVTGWHSCCRVRDRRHDPTCGSERVPYPGTGCLRHGPGPVRPLRQRERGRPDRLAPARGAGTYCTCASSPGRTTADGT